MRGYFVVLRTLVARAARCAATRAELAVVVPAAGPRAVAAQRTQTRRVEVSTAPAGGVPHHAPHRVSRECAYARAPLSVPHAHIHMWRHTHPSTRVHTYIILCGDTHTHPHACTHTYVATHTHPHACTRFRRSLARPAPESRYTRTARSQGHAALPPLAFELSGAAAAS